MPSSIDRSLGHWCSLVGQQYFHVLRERLAHLNIDRRYSVLVYLAEAQESISQQELANKLYMDKVAVVRAVDHLSGLGYLRRTVCAEDRRKHHLELLPKALPVVQQIIAAYSEINDIAFKGMSAARRASFIKELSGILGRLDEAGMPPAKNMKQPQ